MSAADRWLESAEQVYAGEDEAKLLDRAMRVKGDVDRVVIEFAILRELRAIRAALDADGKGKRR